MTPQQVLRRSKKFSEKTRTKSGTKVEKRYNCTRVGLGTTKRVVFSSTSTILSTELETAQNEKEHRAEQRHPPGSLSTELVLFFSSSMNHRFMSLIWKMFEVKYNENSPRDRTIATCRRHVITNSPSFARISKAFFDQGHAKVFFKHTRLEVFMPCTQIVI